MSGSCRSWMMRRQRTRKMIFGWKYLKTMAQASFASCRSRRVAPSRRPESMTMIPASHIP